MDILYRYNLEDYIEKLHSYELQVFEKYPNLFQESTKYFVTFCLDYNLIYYLSDEYLELILADKTYTVRNDSYRWEKTDNARTILHRGDNLPAIYKLNGEDKICCIGWYVNAKLFNETGPSDIVLYDGILKYVRFSGNTKIKIQSYLSAGQMTILQDHLNDALAFILKTEAEEETINNKWNELYPNISLSKNIDKWNKLFSGNLFYMNCKTPEEKMGKYMELLKFLLNDPIPRETKILKLPPIII